LYSTIDRCGGNKFVGIRARENSMAGECGIPLCIIIDKANAR
jgi:hypothetical protein